MTRVKSIARAFSLAFALAATVLSSFAVSNWMCEIKLCLLGDEIVYSLQDFRHLLSQYRLAHSPKEKKSYVQKMTVLDQQIKLQLRSFKKFAAVPSEHKDNWNAVYSKTKSKFDDCHGELEIIRTDPSEDLEPSYAAPTGKTAEQLLSEVRRDWARSGGKARQNLPWADLVSYEFALADAVDEVTKFVGAYDQTMPGKIDNSSLTALVPDLKKAASKSQVKLAAGRSLSALQALLPMLDKIQQMDAAAREKLSGESARPDPSAQHDSSARAGR